MRMRSMQSMQSMSCMQTLTFEDEFLSEDFFDIHDKCQER
jgi:hypothetical protein